MTGANRARPWPTAATHVAGVIGHPVGHSLSPVLHNAAFHSLGLDWAYAAFDVAPGEAPAAVAAFRSLGLRGLSVTMPHKEAVAGAVDRLTPVAQAIGAVNTVLWDGDEVVGDSTDGFGFLDFLDEIGFNPTGRTCAVVGAGGAARSIIHALGSRSPNQILILNRSAERAAQAAALAPSLSSVAPAGAAFDADLIVHATPAGMAGASEDVPVPVESLRSGQVVCDLVYSPPVTPLLRAARGAGAESHSGLGMLIHQAARQITLWTGQEPPLDVMSAAALSALSGANE